ncbi:MAG TPA: ABC transporter permease [Cyclobacteriaceae bacterium]|nr:ABC transporter permease [Cyclobacteriaceae bacterium]
MFKNYLKIAIRSFIGQKTYSLINTVGLALGIAACILILLFVQDELSFERPFKNNGQIYRLVEDFPMGPHLSQSATVPFPTKNTLMADFPEITKAALIFRPSSWGNTPILKLEDVEYYEDDFIFAEQSFLDIYDFRFLKGKAQDALTGPDKLILTASAARKYFGDQDPIGKRLNLSNFRDLEVVGVVEDLPGNTHLQFSMIASFETFKAFFANNPTFFETQWVWVAAWMYFTVEDEVAAEKIKQGLPEYVKRHFPSSLADTGLTLHLQKADDIHLTSNRELEFEANGNIRHVYLFSFIAILVLLIAVINFMNLSTSRSAKRGKEVGLRKVMGAHKKMLVAQFMGEAVLTSFLSLLLAIVFIAVTLPWFNELTGKNISLDVFNNRYLFLGMIGLCSVTGILAGSYPAFVLSSFQPTEVLKGKPGSSWSGNFLRKGLVVCQFVISISLVICIGIVYKQLHYIHNKDMGFNQEQIVTVDVGNNFFNKYGGFKSELLKNGDIQSVTLLGGSIPGKEEVIENAFVASGMPEEQQQWFSVMFASHDFEKTLNVEFLQGHGFQLGSSSDSVGYVINESAARALGWGDDVIGKSIDRLGNGNVLQTGAIIGLVKDFNYRPLYDPIKPLVISLGGNTLTIKIHSEDLQGTLKTIEKEWSAQFEGTPFRYSFMDDNFDLLYRKEDKFGKTIEYFSVLAIFIACLGLLGLSSFTAETRRKEIAIRKVNGASTLGLVGLLTKDFSILVGIAFLVAVPTAYYFSSLWLSNFAYRTGIGVSIFIVSGLVSLGLAVITVSYHTIKAAITNPVISLRYE